MRVFGPYNKTNPFTGAAERVNPTTLDFVHAAIQTVRGSGGLPTLIQMTPPTVRRIASAVIERSGLLPGDTFEFPPKAIFGVPIEVSYADDPEPFRLQYDGGMVVAADVEPNCLPPFTYAQVSD